MITWFKRLKEWEQLMIAIVLGIGSVLGYRYFRDQAHANLLAECYRLSKESLIASTTDGVSMAEADYKRQKYRDCWDRIDNF